MYEWDRENLSLDLKRIYLVAVTTPAATSNARAVEILHDGTRLKSLTN
ncbi:hypothetical protein [Nitrospira sp. Ecomares 2.1]